MAARRLLVMPDATKTVHFLGDVHAGAISQWRLDKLVRDLLSLNVPGCVARVQVGDSCDDGSGAQDALAKAFYARLTDVPMRTVPGNHDLNGNRSIATWAASLGVLATPWTWDLGFVRIIGLGDIDTTTPGSNANNCYLPQSHLDYLDAALAAAGNTPCWIVFHAPLFNTVTGPTGAGRNPQFSSTETLFFEHGPAANSADDSAIRTILGNHTNAKALFNGHTHSDLFCPGFVTTLNLGGHNVASINCSSVYYTGRSAEWIDPCRSIYATQTYTGATPTGMEIRVRDHGAATAVGLGIAGPRVTTVAY